MKNITDYIKQNNLTFAQMPFNPVDSLIFSQFSYIDFKDMVPGFESWREGVSIKDVIRAEYFDEMLREVTMMKATLEMMYAIAVSPRFRDIKLSFYADERDDEAEKQFSAVVFSLNDCCHYAAFRGTDATFLGWKEDFNMAFISPVPSQSAGAEYLKRAAASLEGEIITGGHSKGGNIAIYAAAECGPDIAERISRIYTHDGPGFTSEFLASEGYQRIKGKIHKTIPESALIGMMLENEGGYSVVKSSRMGALQHDPFSWEVGGEDFIIADRISPGAEYMNNTISDWVKALSFEQRQLLVDFLYSVVSAGASTNFAEFLKDSRKEVAAMFDVIKHIDKPTRSVLKNAFREFLAAAVKNTGKGKKVKVGKPKILTDIS
ncbi:MAG: DUF2974 domain-containing protein [Eubacteriaceae bacterium]|nr:DUF2974 domain-containing protein [Eubacteriaceae bacterium]